MSTRLICGGRLGAATCAEAAAAAAAAATAAAPVGELVLEAGAALEAVVPVGLLVLLLPLLRQVPPWLQVTCCEASAAEYTV